MTEISLRMIARLSEMGREAWDHAANPVGAAWDPFLSWDFLEALESSGSAVEQTGWGPRHLVAEDAGGQTLGVLPLYLKAHSYGEYVFDHAWANALERAGGRYYPKLVTAVPFTPATGRRILAIDPVVRRILTVGAQQAADALGASGWHVLFPEAAERAELEATGLLGRQDIQFVFNNPGYRDYSDFLDALASRKRKSLRKERDAAQSGVEIERISGSGLTETLWDVFFDCYQDTGSRKWGTPYLTRSFFSIVGERMADRVLLVIARKDGAPVACALNFIGSDALYGRYWGSLVDQDSLHFELCYHQAIEYAIEHRLSRVEAGAQGAHKLARGYRPVLVHSAHDVRHPGLRAALAEHLQAEQAAVAAEQLALDAESPYKKTS